MKITKNEKRYITAPLKDLLEKSNYKRKDDLYCVLDMIYRRQIYFKNELQKKYGYIEISRTAFQKLIPKPNYIKAAIDFLIEEGLILRNDFYLLGLQAKGYKIKTEYLGKKVAVEITDKKMNERIKSDKLSIRKRRVKNLEFAKSKYYKTFKIDLEGAINAANQKAMLEIRTLVDKTKYKLSDKQIQEIIDCTGDYIKNRMMLIFHPDGKELHSILHRLMIHQQQIFSIADGFLYFKRNATNGRLDTNLTSLPSYLRKYLISNEKLFNLDIKNSQPFFLYTKMKNSSIMDNDELKLYSGLVINGDLYEYLFTSFDAFLKVPFYSDAKDLSKKKREKMKKILFKIFYSKVPSFPKLKEIFRSIFPSLMDHIDLTNVKNNNTLAVELQTLESFMMLDIIMPELAKISITPFTIHDSLIVTESELPIVKEVIERKFIELHGLVPPLHEDELFNLDTDFSEDEIDDFSDSIDESFFAGHK